MLRVVQLYDMPSMTGVLLNTNNTALENFSIRNTGITHLDLTAFSTFKTIGILNSPIQELLLNSYPSLRSMYLSDIPVNFVWQPQPWLSTLSLYNSDIVSLDLTGSTQLSRAQLHNNDLEEVFFYEDDFTSQNSLKTVGNRPALFVCFEEPTTNPNRSKWDYDANTQFVYGCNKNVLEGQVRIDANTNCTAENTESGIAGAVLAIEQSRQPTTYIVTDAQGRYRVHLDTGQYTIRYTPASPYQQACVASRSFSFVTVGAVDTVDWAVQTVVDCPYLTVDLSAPLLRNTTSNTYTVHYCNKGTAVATNAYVDVSLDPALTYVAAGRPLISQNGQMLRFDLDSVGIDQCGRFNVIVNLDTAATFEQTHCSEAHIYPDTSCLNAWNGGFLEVQATCQNDTVFFTVQNTGGAAVGPTAYEIFENATVFYQGTLQLAAGSSQLIAQPATAGNTYRLNIAQDTALPAFYGDSIATAAIEGCRPFLGGGFQTGFITQFSNGDRAPHRAVDCQQNRGSYDPNDKAAQPVGYDSAYHYITPTTALDYKVRFQNTGTDTAFNVVILDTLSPYLNVSSLQMGASSHHYTWSMQQGNILRVTFANIMLPDSNVNEPLSNGFFRYRIEQQPNNPLDSVIYNSAAIYFDYNPPIITNTTFHTIGINFIQVQLVDTRVLDAQIQLKVYPNPFAHQTTLELPQQHYERLHLKVYDAAGRLVTQTQAQGNQVVLERGQLQTGLYFYELNGDGQRLATGKLIAQ